MPEEAKTDGVLDPAALESLREMVGGDDAFLAELIDTFLEDAPQMLADIRQGVEDGDAERLRRAAHSLKSNSIQFGASALSESCKQLEMMGKTSTLEGADEKAARAEAEYEQVKAAIEAMLSGL